MQCPSKDKDGSNQIGMHSNHTGQGSEENVESETDERENPTVQHLVL